MMRLVTYGIASLLVVDKMYVCSYVRKVGESLLPHQINQCWTYKPYGAWADVDGHKRTCRYGHSDGGYCTSLWSSHNIQECQDLSSVHEGTLWTVPVVLRTNQTSAATDRRQPTTTTTQQTSPRKIHVLRKERGPLFLRTEECSTVTSTVWVE